MTQSSDLLFLLERIFSTVFPLVAIVALGFVYVRKTAQT